MEVKQSSNQHECRGILADIGMLDMMNPPPGEFVRDGVALIAPHTFIVASYDRGTYTVAMLKQATTKEAVEYAIAIHRHLPFDWSKPRYFCVSLVPQFQN